MGKIHHSKDLQSRRISRPLLALSLAASLAAVGCSTNLNPGSGAPMRVGPELRTTPTSGVTSGSERPTTPPPMTSSYTRADQAAAIMAGHQPARGRYLGPANPGPIRAYASDAINTGFVNPAPVTNPQLSVNSSISSQPVAAINSGVGGLATTGVTAATTTGTTAAATITGTQSGSSLPTVTAASAGTGVRIVRDTSSVTITNASGNRQ